MRPALSPAYLKTHDDATALDVVCLAGACAPAGGGRIRAGGRASDGGYSFKHYQDFFTSSDWQGALRNSVMIAPAATLLSVSFGTLAAIGLSQPHVPFRRAIMAILISPMIVPLIISAAGMYFFYSRIGLQGTYFGVALMAYSRRQCSIQ